LARDGFILTRGDTDIIDAGSQRLSRDAETRKLFFREDGSPLRPGDRLKQPDLARTLEAVAHRGANAFYKSAIAGRVAAAMRRDGGIITRQDLASYTVTEGAPIYCTYRGYLIASAPPPSSGGTALCEILNILEGYDMRGLGFHSAASAHYLVEAMRRAYIDRNTSLGDPAFVKNPIERLLSKDYAAQVRKTIDPERATLSRLPPAPPGPRAAKRETGDHPLFHCRWKGKRGRGHLHDQRVVRRRSHRAGHRFPSQRRDGRLHRQNRCAKPLRTRTRRGECHRAWQAAFVVH